MRVAGDLEHPRLEPGKAAEFMWVDWDNLERLSESRNPVDAFIHDLVRRGLELSRAAA